MRFSMFGAGRLNERQEEFLHAELRDAWEDYWRAQLRIDGIMEALEEGAADRVKEQYGISKGDRVIVRFEDGEQEGVCERAYATRSYGEAGWGIEVRGFTKAGKPRKDTWRVSNLCAVRRVE